MTVAAETELNYPERRVIDAMEYGHQARLTPHDRRSFRVVSETRHGDVGPWIVTVRNRGSHLQFDCTCESGTRRRGHPLPCWHGGRVALRLKRERLAYWTVAGTFAATDLGAWLDALDRPPLPPEPADPFACFPKL